MKTQAYIYLESDQVYGDYIDHFYNEHNIKSAQWFFEKVYPLLPLNISICVVGRICNYIGDYSNVTKIEFVEDLDTLYKQSKITICPMLSGTGVKIKVIESLSFGLPVVCNERGVDGLLNKNNNGCLVAEDENQFANNIIKLLKKEEFYNIIKSEAISFFDKNHSQSIVYQKLDKIFEIEKSVVN